MEAFLVSAASVAVAEIGDKTQLLALVLAARFRKPWPIVAGILLATALNHGIAAELGAWLTTLLSPQVLRWAVAASFIAMGLWILVPDSGEDAAARYAYGAFLTTLISFFLVEIGDKTQIATVLLAAKYHSVPLVVTGTTVGILAANVPVVLAGGFAAERLPLKLIHGVAAVLFIVLGVLAVLAGRL
ncbi:MAG TPA: TMEM165/GDT1 family protein [Gammaproteobacteria bacterium]|nr:TMEM165/GDT1 family protein [Gammaproteobacteria bacterium]